MKEIRAYWDDFKFDTQYVNEEDIAYDICYTTLKDLEEVAYRQMKNNEVKSDTYLYIAALKEANIVYRDVYDYCLDEIAEDIFIFQVEYNIDGKEYVELFMSLFEYKEYEEICGDDYASIVCERIADVVEQSLGLDIVKILDDNEIWELRVLDWKLNRDWEESSDYTEEPYSL